MSTLTEARKGLAELLEAALEGKDARPVPHVPEELHGPSVVIDAADDWLSLGETYSGTDVWVTLRVFCLVDLVGNEQAIEDLENLITDVLPALVASPWEVDPIGKPQPFHTTTWLAHGVAITVRNLITLNPGDTP